MELLTTPRGQLTEPPMARLHVGKDLDGCYYDFAANYWTSCCRLGLIDEPNWWVMYPPQATHWEFYEDHGHTLEQFLANCNEAADKGLLWGGSVWPGGKESWGRVAERGHFIHVKTDRAFGSHPIASEVGTRMWLGMNQLRFHTLTFGPDKTAGPPVDIMLEDRLANYDALEQSDTCGQVWLMDRPWNQDPGDNRRRVYTHDEWVIRVDALAREKAREWEPEAVGA